MCDCLYDEEIEEWRQLQKIKRDPKERKAEPVHVELVARQ